MTYRCLWCKREVFEVGMNTGSIQFVMCNICLPQFKLVIDGNRKSLQKIEKDTKRQESIIAASAALNN